MICAICVATRILRLSNRSANEPAIGASIKAGKPAAKFTSPSKIALVVSPLMTQLWAIICIHVPLSEMSEPMMYRRNGPCRKSASDFNPTRFSCSFIANTHSRDKRLPQWMSACLASTDRPHPHPRFRNRQFIYSADEDEGEWENEIASNGLETAERLLF